LSIGNETFIDGYTSAAGAVTIGNQTQIERIRWTVGGSNVVLLVSKKWIAGVSITSGISSRRGNRIVFAPRKWVTAVVGADIVINTVGDIGKVDTSRKSSCIYVISVT